MRMDKFSKNNQAYRGQFNGSSEQKFEMESRFPIYDDATRLFEKQQSHSVNKESVEEGLDTTEINNYQLIEEIIKLTHQCPIVFTSITDAETIFIWLNDDDIDIKNVIDDIAVKNCDAEIIIIDASKHNRSISNTHFNVKKGSEVALVLGFFCFYNQLSEEELIRQFHGHCALEPFRSLIEAYSLSNVEKWTELKQEKLLLIYQKLVNNKAIHHHLMMGQILNHANVVQAIRAIALLPVFNNFQTGFLPLSFDGQVNDSVPYDFDAFRLFDRMGKSIRCMTEKKCAVELQENNQSFRSLLYNVSFADRFDVDPFPLFIQK
ncbi:hypothetical protein SAMN05421736_12097 [Evansella caseinilytica]|uniref:Uncharacterized protein n=1 Tax=Evansella caseinilytica TaxID=1503961 RepID=A0A1H3UED1_9BACI|nr:hypothetical protein [Evansella caseinilytica]SDZ60738.1 hypothetical protein SAMN05421736_12097 [Evansella caseinilytica]